MRFSGSERRSSLTFERVSVKSVFSFCTDLQGRRPRRPDSNFIVITRGIIPRAYKHGTEQGDALTCRASPLRKQPTGLFSDSPLAERLRFVSPLSKSCERRPETLSLDSASL